jgi:hypothetical protein
MAQQLGGAAPPNWDGPIKSAFSAHSCCFPLLFRLSSCFIDCMLCVCMYVEWYYIVWRQFHHYTVSCAVDMWSVSDARHVLGEQSPEHWSRQDCHIGQSSGTWWTFHRVSPPSMFAAPVDSFYRSKITWACCLEQQANILGNIHHIL